MKSALADFPSHVLIGELDSRSRRHGRSLGGDPAPSEAPQPSEPMCSRQSARGVLDDLIGRTERRLERLRALSAILPAVIPPEADEALWEILCEIRAK